MAKLSKKQVEAKKEANIRAIKLLGMEHRELQREVNRLNSKYADSFITLADDSPFKS